MELFKLFGSVMLEGTDKTEKQLDSIDKKGSGVGTKLATAGKTVAKAGAAMATGAALAGAAIFGMATKASETADRIDKMSQKIGISRTAFQEWDFIMSQSGASVEGLQMGVKTLSKAAFEASQGVATYADSFDALGVSVTNADGSLKDQEILLNETIAALAGMENATERTALASELLGKSATELAPLLNGGTEALEEMRQKSHDLGLILSDTAVDAGVAFTDTMDQLKRTLGGLFTSALAPLLPIINDLAQQFILILPPLMSFIGPLIEKLMPVVERLMSQLFPALISILNAIIPALDPIIDLFLMLVDTALMPLLNMLIPIIEEAMPIFIELFRSLMPAIAPIIDLIMTLVKTVLPPLMDIFFALIDAGLIPIINLLMPLITEILPLFTHLFILLMPAIQSIADILIKLIEFIMPPLIKLFKNYYEVLIPALIKGFDLLTDVFKAIGEVFDDIWGGIKNTFKSVINFILGGINSIIRGLNKIHFKLPDWVPFVGGKGFGINIGEIPLLAKGGDITRSGRVIVGDAGPEVLTLPQGARVTPLNQAGSGVNIIMNYPRFNTKRETERTLNDLVDRINLKVS